MHISYEKVKRVRVNHQITAPQVRLIDVDGNQLGVVDLSEAQLKAKEAELDLVEIAGNIKPPVCKIMNYGKYLFEQSKKQKKKSKQIVIKEVKMRSTTDVGDYAVKLKKIIGFLEEGDKVKITIRFRGREIVYQQLGRDMLQRMEADLVDHAIIEQTAKLEGKQLSIVVAPKRNK